VRVLSAKVKYFAGVKAGNEVEIAKDFRKNEAQ